MDQASSLRKIVSAKARQTPQRLMTPAAPDSAISAPAPRGIAVTSGKGGVGKTNIVGSLALVLATRGHKVLILDRAALEHLLATREELRAIKLKTVLKVREMGLALLKANIGG